MQIRLKSSRAKNAKRYPPKKKQKIVRQRISSLEYHLMRKDLEADSGREWDGHKDCW